MVFVVCPTKSAFWLSEMFNLQRHLLMIKISLIVCSARLISAQEEKQKNKGKGKAP